jgi:hypothetical protein
MGGCAALLQAEGGRRGCHRDRQALSALATATTTGLACFPRALSCRSSVHSRTWACQLISWTGCGAFLQAQLPVAADVRRRPVRPGAFDEGVSRMSVPRRGERALPPPLTTGVFRGGQASVTHELSGVVTARQLCEFCDDGDGDRNLPAPPGVQGLDHRLQPPGVHLLAECVCKTL